MLDTTLEMLTAFQPARELRERNGGPGSTLYLVGSRMSGSFRVQVEVGDTYFATPGQRGESIQGGGEV